MTTTAKLVRVLPAEVFDLLNHSAEAFGGIGGNLYSHGSHPCCALGHAGFLDTTDGDLYHGIGEGAVSFALAEAGVSSWENDCAVAAINGRRFQHYTNRVSFEDWTAELNVVRGDS